MIPNGDSEDDVDGDDENVANDDYLFVGSVNY